MTNRPSVRPTGPPGQSPPTPARMEFETDWKARAPDGDEVTVELWGDRGRGDAEVRILHGAILGTLARASTSDMQPTPNPDAVKLYGSEWVEHQLRSASQSLAIRWGPSAFDRRRR